MIASIAEGPDTTPDFFEDLKSVGKAARAAAAGDASVSEGPRSPSGPMQFECPQCGAEVAADAKECPSCGAQFAEEVEDRFECPSCHFVVSAQAAKCPSCGVTFASEAEPAPSPAVTPRPPPIAARALDLGPIEEAAAPPAPAPARRAVPIPEVELRARIEAVRELRGRSEIEPVITDKRALYRELPRLVNAVKPLLLGAKRAGVEIDEEKKLINEAIASGKARDIERAVRLVAQAKKRLADTFTQQLTDRAELLVGELERAKAAGGNMAPVQALLTGALEPLEAGQYLEASDRLALARDEFERRASGYHRARQAVASAEALAKDTQTFGVEARDADRLLRLAQEAFGRQDWDSATNLAEQARASLRAVLPGFLEAEMKRARNALLDLKVRGADLSRPIGILKQASIHLKRQDYAEAMRYVRMYRREIESAQVARPAR